MAHWKRLLFIIMLVGCAVLSGCGGKEKPVKETVEKTEAAGREASGKETAGAETSGAENSGTETAGAEIPGTGTASGKLVRIKYAVSSGTAYGCDFSIEVTPQQIVSARFFSEEQMDYVLLEQEPLEEAQWKDFERAVSELVPVLEEASPVVWESSEDSDIFMLDGGDTFSFALTWEEGGEERRVEYRNPNDRKFCLPDGETLKELQEFFQEMVGQLKEAE